MLVKKILVYVFAIIALVFEGFFGILPLIQFIFQTAILAVAVFLFISIFRKNNWQQAKVILSRYITTIFATVGFFTALSLSLVAYQNATPGVISDITLTHSGQSVVFVEMSHIATPEFYQSKKETIQDLAKNGYTILFEGVKPGTPENQRKFDQAMGFQLTPTLYKTVADLIGLKNQDNQSLYEGISTGSLVSVDMSIDEIVQDIGTGTTSSGTMSMNLESEINEAVKILSSREKTFISWIARGALNYSLKQSSDIDDMLISGPQRQLFQTIIHRRNDKIVDYIIANPTKKIAIIYGALHSNGVYESLQKKDKNWVISTIKTSTPYDK